MQRRREGTTRTLILGKQGSGKTTLAKLNSWAERVVIFNPNAIGGWSCPRSWRPEEIRRRLHSGAGFRFSIVPEDSASWPGVVASACEAIFALDAEILVVFDEMDSFWPARQPTSEIANLVQFGRNRGISWLGTTRRPAEIHRTITASLTHITTFRMEEPRDLEYLQAYAGGRMATLAKQLRRYEYLAHDLATQRTYKGCT